MRFDDRQPVAAMRRLRRIVVGHDFEAGGATAMESALTLARRWRADIRLVHVVKPAARFEGWRRPTPARRATQQNVALAGAQMERIVSSHRFTRCAMDGEIRVGKTAAELALASWAWKADLLIIGRSSQGSSLFGLATAAFLVREAGVPVLVSCAPLSQALERIVVPTNFSPASRIAAEQGLAIAQSVGGRVFFFHALDPRPWETSPWGDEMAGWMNIADLTPADIETDWKEFLDPLPIGSVPWETCTETGRAVNLIARYAETNRADLLVVGAEGRTGLRRLLGSSVAESVVSTASCPVLVLSPWASQVRLPSPSSVRRRRHAYG